MALLDHKLIKWLIIIAVALGLGMMPNPAELTSEAWKLFAVFVATIVGFIIQPLAMGAFAFV
ncbi:MAG: anion permease, partial [Sporomusa sp.]